MRRASGWRCRTRVRRLIDSIIRSAGRPNQLAALAIAGLLVLVFSACSLDSGEVSFLTYDGDPDWSPDGRTIAFVSSRGKGGLYVLGSDGKGLRLVIGGEARDLDWSPDGRMLAFTRDDGIYVIKSTGGKPRRVLAARNAADVPSLSWPTWAPDGKRLAFVKRLPDGSSAIHVVRLDGHGARRLLPKYRGSVGDARPGSPAALSEMEPAWSPDGKEIAFQAGDGQLAIARLTDGRRRVLADQVAYEPAWSPNGRLLAYQCEGELCVVNVDGSEPQRLASDGGDPSWAPDSHRLVFEHYLYSTEAGLFTGDAQSLTIYDLRTGDSEKLTYGPDLPATH